MYSELKDRWCCTYFLIFYGNNQCFKILNVAFNQHGWRGVWFFQKCWFFKCIIIFSDCRKGKSTTNISFDTRMVSNFYFAQYKIDLQQLRSSNHTCIMSEKTQNSPSFIKQHQQNTMLATLLACVFKFWGFILRKPRRTFFLVRGCKFELSIFRFIPALTSTFTLLLSNHKAQFEIWKNFFF